MFACHNDNRKGKDGENAHCIFLPEKLPLLVIKILMIIIMCHQNLYEAEPATVHLFIQTATCCVLYVYITSTLQSLFLKNGRVSLPIKP